MAEIALKRPREETQVQEEEETKRHRSYNHILSILESDEDDINQDLSSLISSLQEELSSDLLPGSVSKVEPNIPSDTINEPISSSPVLFNGDEDNEDNEEKVKVVRHLLQASDDELGIPSTAENRFVKEEDEINNVGGEISYYDGLWEFDDEAANYYSLLQSDFLY